MTEGHARAPTAEASVLLCLGLKANPYPDEGSLALRIVHIMAPSPVGGAEQVVLDLTSSLLELGAGVHLVPILDEGAGPHPFVQRIGEGVQVHPLRFPPRRYAQERRQVRALVEELSPCIVHTHGYRADVVAAAAARSIGVPTVTTVHGFTGGGLRNRLYEWMQRRAFRRFDAVVAVSRPLAEALEGAAIAPDRIRTIPNARARPGDLLGPAEAREVLDVEPGAFHVGWVGRVSPEKGPDLMLLALRKLEAEGRLPDLRATFIGDGRLRSELQGRTRSWGLEGAVAWKGRVPDAVRLFRAFDVLVLSSRTEGTPIVGLEAMLAEVPLVATRVGGVPDLTGPDGALLVQPEDADALAAAIRAVWADPEAAQRRVKAARERTAEFASTEAWADRYMEVYREVCRTVGPRQSGSVTEASPDSVGSR